MEFTINIVRLCKGTTHSLFNNPLWTDGTFVPFSFLFLSLFYESRL
jgi:hypothetical protein